MQNANKPCGSACLQCICETDGMQGCTSAHDTLADTSLPHTTSRTQGLDLTCASVGCSIPGAAFAHLPSLKEGQDNSKGTADRKKASMKPSGGVLTFLHRLRPGRPGINRVANRTPSTSHPSLDSRNAWQALSETSGSEDSKVRLDCVPGSSAALSQVASICITDTQLCPFMSNGMLNMLACKFPD